MILYNIDDNTIIKSDRPLENHIIVYPHETMHRVIKIRFFIRTNEFLDFFIGLEEYLQLLPETREKRIKDYLQKHNVDYEEIRYKEIRIFFKKDYIRENLQARKEYVIITGEESVEDEIYGKIYFCNNCCHSISLGDNFCMTCGKKIIWQLEDK